jgi:predicted transcriptional regulator
MVNGYERASKEIVPAIRLAIAKELKERYGMTESNIAQILGVAQAAVSKYLNKKCSFSVGDVYKRIDTAKIDAYIERISKGDKLKLKQCICSICCTLNDFDCEFSKPSSQAN